MAMTVKLMAALNHRLLKYFLFLYKLLLFCLQQNLLKLMKFLAENDLVITIFLVFVVVAAAVGCGGGAAAATTSNN